MTTHPGQKKRGADGLIGTILAGKYHILEKIGEGGMGSVFIARQEPIDRKVAVKVLLSKLIEDEMAVKRFEQEAIAISKMQHPNTVTIYDFGQTEDGQLYIVMELLRGKTLTQLMRSDGPLPAARATRIARQVCASLADAHGAGIIHRDLKPDNIFLSSVGSDPDWVKVLDFGVAKLADGDNSGTLTKTGMIFGTPKYMSPEQAEGRPIDYRADIYAIGVVLYEMLTGRPPFVADTPVGLLLKHISEAPTPFKKIRPDLNIEPTLEQIVMRALEKVPDQRYQMISDLARELQRFERIATGDLLPGRPVSGEVAAGLPGVPTELIPGTQQGPAITAGGLPSPAHVPTNLSSLSLPGQTADLDARTEHSPPVAGRGKAGPTSSPSTHAMTAAGGTQPGALGAFSGGFSGDLEVRPKPKASLYLGGAALLLAAAGVVAFALLTPGSNAQVAPLVEPIHSSVVPEPSLDPVESAGTDRQAEPTPDERSPEPTPVDSEAEVQPAQAEGAERRPGTGRRRDPVSGDEHARRGVEAAEGRVVFTLESEPKGAMVELRGKQLGYTPLTLEFPKDGDVLQFEFKKPGFKSKLAMRSSGRDQKVSVDLDPDPSSIPGESTTPRLDPRPKGKGKGKGREEPVEEAPIHEKVGDLK